MRPSIREAATSDRQRLLALAPRLLEGVAPWRPRQAVLEAVTDWVRSAQDDLANGDQTVLVADYDNSIAGFVHVSEKQHWAGQTDAYIGELVVAPEFEGRGIGSELVQTAIDWSRARGLERITLETGVRNSRARHLYASLGFEEEGVTLCAHLEHGRRR